MGDSEQEESIGPHFFAIQELLLLVLSYISPPGKGTVYSIDTDTLASLARVSRNISNAALDALWRSMHQPDAIIRLLPPDAYQVTYTEDFRPRQYSLKRPLTANDFVVFDKYAPRIHYVDFSRWSRVLGPGCQLFPYIKDFRDPIFPALADFRWEPSVQNGCIGAFHLLSRKVSLPSEEFFLLVCSKIEDTSYQPDSSDQSDAILRTIDAFNDPALPWFPNVKKLTLRTLHFLPAVEAAVQRLFNLEYLSCDFCVGDALIEHLANLPRLRFLDLRSLSGIATIDPDGTHFPVLESLRVSGTLPSIAALLPLISSPELLSVSLKAEDLTSASPASSLSSLCSLLFPPSVPTRTSTACFAHFFFHRSFGTRSIGANPGSNAPTRLPLAAFSPLYACTGLQTFEVNVNPLAISVTDADVHAMARAWPLITTLIIVPPRASRENPPGVRLYALWALAAGCPRLRTLAMEVDANSEVKAPFRAEEGTTSSSGHAVMMNELMLYTSPCGDPLLVADFLNRAFPRLPSHAFHVFSTEQESQAKWVVVTEALAYVE